MAQRTGFCSRALDLLSRTAALILTLVILALATFPIFVLWCCWSLLIEPALPPEDSGDPYEDL